MNGEADSISSPQPVEGARRKQPQRAITMPLLIANAPSAFRARHFSLERLRVDYGITRRSALELVLAGLVVELDRRSPAIQARRAA